ncbi:FAD-dependent monooxygenase [Mycolicibacterium sp. XJ1904]
MTNPEETQVLIAGAGPVGLTAAIELARRSVDCRIVDPLPEPPLYAKAVGVQPRSLEVFENLGILGRILDAATPMRGQLVYVNGEQVAKADFDVPADVPFGFVAIPQYATERILRDELAARGVRVERGWRLTGFDQDADVADTTLPLIRDADGQFARAYDCAERAMFVVRPDGYLGYAAAHVDAENLAAHLRSTFTR